MDDKQLYRNKYRIKSARATWCNYNEGCYFITICTALKIHYFGEIIDTKMIYTTIGDYALQCILKIQQLHPSVIIPYYVVMPNHIHLIVSMTGTEQVGTPPVETPQCDVSIIITRNANMQRIANQCGTLSHLISQFKTAVTKYARNNYIEFEWQTRFHDHIIKNDKEFARISEYIQNNVYRWSDDCYNISGSI